jgi:hypothetical protein
MGIVTGIVMGHQRNSEEHLLHELMSSCRLIASIRSTDIAMSPAVDKIKDNVTIIHVPPSPSFMSHGRRINRSIIILPTSTSVILRHRI